MYPGLPGHAVGSTARKPAYIPRISKKNDVADFTKLAIAFFARAPPLLVETDRLSPVSSYRALIISCFISMATLSSKNARATSLSLKCQR